MKNYLVGGAVRDKLLRLPVTDQDWVVVGGNLSQMEALGFIQIGKGFPVFLHPETKDEYALARTEVKLNRVIPDSILMPPIQSHLKRTCYAEI